MLKATLRGAVLLGLLVLATGPAFAEVQNVKVGGDITARAFLRKNLDLNQEGSSTADTSGAGGTPLEGDNFFMSTVGLNIGADLTENVSAFVRLVNERDWNQDSSETSNFDMSQAYITLKELFYSPLTLRVGAQPIVWGRGFILGSSMLPDTLNGVGGSNDRNAAITANEYTDFTAFDAIRATVDLAGVAGLPLTADAVYIKLDENTPGVPDDRNIMGINLGARFDAMSSEVEAYYLNMRDKNGALVQTDQNGSLSTMGIRGSAHPVEGSSVYGELAFQFGKRTPAYDGETNITSTRVSDAQHGWAFDLGTDYTFKDVATTPMVGAEWIFTSGNTVGNQAVTGWMPIAPSYFPTLLRAFQTRSTGVGLYPVDQTGVTSAYTNQHEIALYGSVKPIEDLTASTRLSWFAASVPIRPFTTGSGAQKRDHFLGTEWDAHLVYDYTDDVQFGVDYGAFFPGDIFVNAEGGSGIDKAAAQELISKVSVKF